MLREPPQKLGQIIIPYGAIIAPHELNVAKILIQTGNDVEFIPTSYLPTPDIFYLGKKWEIKSPTGTSSRTIENNLRNALKQSPNIIIDLQRTKRPEDACLRDIKRNAESFKQIKTILVITKSHKILDFSPRKR